MVKGHVRRLTPVGHASRRTSCNVSTDQGDPCQSGLSSGILAGIGANLPILLLSAVLTVAAILISPKKPFWIDELFSYYFLSAESFETLLGAFHDKLNNSPFAYFGLGWLWGKAFGVTELSLRLLSS